MTPNSLPTAPDKTSPLWFFTAFFAVILAGIAKVAIANHFSPDASD